jgi:amino acid permease
MATQLSATTERDKEKHDLHTEPSPDHSSDSVHSAKEEAIVPVRSNAFGGGAEAGGENFQVLGRWKTSLIFINNEVGIGILSLPTALSYLGLIPGLIVIIGLGLLSTYTAYVLLQFWRKHPQCDNVVDVFRIIGGPKLAGFVAFCFILNLCLTCASACLTMSIAFNTLSSNAICTVAWIAIPLILCWLLCIPRSFDFVAKFGIPGLVSILASVFIVMIAVGVGVPQNASPNWPADRNMKLFGTPTFVEGLTSIVNIAFAYGGNQGFLSVMAEMRDPSKDFVPSLLMLQAFAIPMYCLVGGVIYGLAGDLVTSPALGTAPRVPAMVAYAIIIPCLLATGLVFGHTAIKYLYVKAMRDIVKAPEEMTANTVKSWVTWIGLGSAFWIVAFILANAIPVFNSIISVSSALFVSWFTFGISAVMWLYMNWRMQFTGGWRKTSLAVANWLILALTLFFNSAGMYGAVSELMAIFADRANNVDGPFTCGDNSLF